MCGWVVWVDYKFEGTQFAEQNLWCLWITIKCIYILRVATICNSLVTDRGRDSREHL